MQTIDIFQSLWAMDQLRPDGYEWSLGEKFEKISTAGFDGVDIVYGDYTSSDVAQHLHNNGLACTITAFPDSIEALKPAIEMASGLDAQHLNIIGKVYTV